MYQQPWQSLGEFRPSIYQEEVIAAEFRRFLRLRRGFGLPFTFDDLYVEVRDPSQNNTIRAYDGDVSHWWHHDVGNDSDLVIWSTATPTEFRALDGTLFTPRPFEVVLVHNAICQHRMPAVISEDRWFIRVIFLYGMEERKYVYL